MYKTIYDEKRKQWSGVKTRPLYNPKVTIGEVLLKAMQVHGPKIAQISDDSDVQLTFQQTRERTLRAAVNLQNRGYKERQVFTLIARNSEHLAPITFAAFCLGCPINPLDTSFGDNEIMHMLNITKPNLVFCDADVHENVARCLVDLSNIAKIITFNGKVGDSEQVEDLFVETGAEPLFIPASIDGSKEIIGIFCSSGTTGLPKGVSLSHVALMDTQAHFELIQSHDVLLCFSQLYWQTGLITLIWGTLYGATRIITTEKFSVELAFRLIPQYKITFALNAVYQMVLMLKHEKIHKTDLTSLMNYCVGGSKVPLGLPVEFNKYFPDGETHIIIGMTEIGGVYASGRAKNCIKDTVGQLSYNVEAKIVDENGIRCGPNVTGELCLNKPYNFVGYYNNLDATKEAYDAEGYFLTGDICFFDADGDLFVVDRKKDMLKYCNYQVTPSEIETVLIRIPEIEAACVVGIPDLVALDLPAAAIIRKRGSKITTEQIYGIVANQLADQYKLRGGVYFVDSLPTTASGKVLRRMVKKELIQLNCEKVNGKHEKSNGKI